MEQKSGSQLLLSFMLLGVFCSQVLALPAVGTYSAMRNTRHADGLFTSAYSKLLGEQSARRYLESLIGKRVGSDNNPIYEQEPVKRHIDGVFTDLYSRMLARQQLNNYMRAVLAENDRQERLKKARESTAMAVPETATSENADDEPVDEIELLNALPLNL